MFVEQVLCWVGTASGPFLENNVQPPLKWVDKGLCQDPEVGSIW